MLNKLFKRLKGKGEELSKGAPFKITEGLQSQVCIGLNWSGIPRKGLFSKAIKLHDPVDLDGAVASYKGDQLDEVISYKNMLSKNGSMRHSGDDRRGDLEGNDGLDNESIVINLKKVHQNVTSIYVYLRSVHKRDFADIPYSILRIFEVIPKSKSKRVFAIFNLSKRPEFRKNYAMLMGKFERQTDLTWNFIAIGEPLPETDLLEIGKYIGREIVKE